VRAYISSWDGRSGLKFSHNVKTATRGRFQFWGRVEGGGGAATPQKLFFSFFIFLQRTMKKSRFGTPKFLGVRGPGPHNFDPLGG